LSLYRKRNTKIYIWVVIPNFIVNCLPPSFCYFYVNHLQNVNIYSYLIMLTRSTVFKQRSCQRVGFRDHFFVSQFDQIKLCHFLERSHPQQIKTFVEQTRPSDDFGSRHSRKVGSRWWSHFGTLSRREVFQLFSIFLSVISSDLLYSMCNQTKKIFVVKWTHV
jgi:hypothetical protein